MDRWRGARILETAMPIAGLDGATVTAFEASADITDSAARDPHLTLSGRHSNQVAGKQFRFAEPNVQAMPPEKTQIFGKHLPALGNFGLE
jgi:hypothetical protein